MTTTPTATLPDPRTAVLAAIAMIAFAANSLLCRMALLPGPDGATAIDAAGFTAVRTVAGAITLALIVWLIRNRDGLTAVALGLLIGGAIGNTIDRIIHGAVVDFVSLHAAGFYWYVFNLADVWVVAGVGLLLYDAFWPGRRSVESAR